MMAAEISFRKLDAHRCWTKTLDRVTTYFVGYRPEITTVTLTEAVMTEFLLGTSQPTH